MEYRACREEIETMLAQGYTARIVYEHMKKQGRVTCSYSAFCDYMRGGGKRKHSTGQNKQQAQLRASPPVLQQSGPRIIRSEPKKFVKPSDIDPDTLF